MNDPKLGITREAPQSGAFSAGAATGGLTRENLLLIVPPALTQDPAMMARAAADAEAMAARLAEIDRVRIISNIDGLNETVLDILARDFKVDWWDPNYSLEEKRRTLKDSWRVHKMLGTKAAVETAISAIYPRTKVLEWWEYGGEPYHFRLDINITNDTIDSEKQRRVLERMNFYKSLRSHNDGVTYFVQPPPAIARAAGCAPGVETSLWVPLELPVPVIRPAAKVRAGGVTALWESVKVRAELPTEAIRARAEARAGAAVGLCEEFTARIALPEGKPPGGRAVIRAGAAAAWQICCTVRTDLLMSKAITAAASIGARGAAAATHETVRTHINLQEVDYGGTE